jgi:hypothetical protein
MFCVRNDIGIGIGVTDENTIERLQPDGAEIAPELRQMTFAEDPNTAKLTEAVEAEDRTELHVGQIGLARDQAERARSN